MVQDKPTRRTRLICPVTGTDTDAMRRQMRQAVEAGADTVECRLDYLDPPPDEDQLERLLADAPADVIVTNRPAEQGGRWDGPEPPRLRVLRDAAELGPAFVDLEMEADREELPARAAVIASYHDFRECPANLDVLVSKLSSTGAAVCKIAYQATGPEDALKAFDVLRACPRPTIALAMGEHGVMSRILAGKFGAFGTFAALAAGQESAPGQPTLAEMRQLYRWDAINEHTEVYGVIGCPVGHSMSPAIHNAAFGAAGLNAVYVPIRVEPGAENFNRFMDALLARPWTDFRGLSVTIPHKESALAYVGAENCDQLARKIGAVNTISILPDGRLYGDNTDYAAAIDALCGKMAIQRTDLAARGVAVLGAGGAARALVAALAHHGANVTVYNRTVERAETLAAEFDGHNGACRAQPLSNAAATDCQVIINCTPIGMHPNVGDCPLEGIPPAVQVVFDTIYNPVETKLLAMAKAADRITVSGVEMFVNQAVAQFEQWTKTPAPREQMRRVVLERLAAG